MSSFSATDIDNFNNACDVSSLPQKYGYKMGRARVEFTATGGKDTGTYGLGLTIPAKSYVTKAFYKVLTTFTSASADAGTIALQVASANDLVSAVAISDGSNPWDASGLVVCIPTGSMANEVAVSTAAEVSAVVGTAALTAGKLVLWLEWVYYGDVTAT